MKPVPWQAHCAEESRAEPMQSALLSLLGPQAGLRCRTQLQKLPEPLATHYHTVQWPTSSVHGFRWSTHVVFSEGLSVCFFSWRCDIAAMVCCQTPRSLRGGDRGFAPLAAAALLSLLFAGMQQATAFPSWRLEVCSDHFTARKSCRGSSASPAFCLGCSD